MAGITSLAGCNGLLSEQKETRITDVTLVSEYNEDFLLQLYAYVDGSEIHYGSVTVPANDEMTLSDVTQGKSGSTVIVAYDEIHNALGRFSVSSTPPSGPLSITFTFADGKVVQPVESQAGVQ